MSVTTCARPDCRQMDGTRHSDPGAGNDALRRTATRDWRHLAKNAHPNFAQPGARWLGATQSASGRAAESGIFPHQIGANFNRTAARALSMVRKTFARIAGKSGASESCSRPRKLSGLTAVARAVGKRSRAQQLSTLQCIKPKLSSFCSRWLRRRSSSLAR